MSETKAILHGTCQRTIVEKDWTGRSKRKCGKKATHRQEDGIPICAYHYESLVKKIGKSRHRSIRLRKLQEAQSGFDQVIAMPKAEAAE